MDALARSPQKPRILAAPGNPGIAELAECRAVAAHDLDAIVLLARAECVDLVVVGPEGPLVAGLADKLATARIACFGPRAEAAQLEGSKAFAKEVMAAAGVPTAAWQEVDTVAAGLAAIDSYPAVLKFDGLAAGKGVVIALDESTARRALEEMLEARRFGDGRVVVEEYMEGEELSLFALCDGVRAVPLAPAQDYKRIFDGDQGPNTGGMGAYSPVPGAPDPAELCRLIHQPVVDLMRERGAPFCGLLYAGLMLTEQGVKVVEFNVRFGDPETQVVLPRLRSDLYAALLATTKPGGLDQVELEFDDRCAVTVVLASRGYPESSSSGDAISGVADAAATGAEVLHAGTALDGGGRLVTAGGRVLSVTALGDTLGQARAAAYAAAGKIDFDGRQARTDIALRAVPAEELQMTDQSNPVQPPAQVLDGPSDRVAAPLSDEQTLAQLAETDPDAPRVGIIMGSQSDMDTMQAAAKVIEDGGVRCEVRVMSAHRDPEMVADYCRNARMRGLRVIIAGAGLSAALPGVAAAHTDLPVIGVPLSSRLSAAGGLDAILSVAQMPPGVPVACVGLDNPKNAGHLALRILRA